MNERISTLRDALLAGEHHALRQPEDPAADEAFAAQIADAGLPTARRVSARLARHLGAEVPVVGPDERIGMWRTVVAIPDIMTPAERASIGDRAIHELGRVCNLAPDYASTIRSGLLAPRTQAEEGLAAAADDDERDFLTSVIESIDAVLDLTDRYAARAADVGNATLAEIFARVPRAGATTFHEALVMFRVLHFALWSSGTYHNVVGRFDLPFWPYLEADLRDGRITEDGALELVEDFFLSFNRDSDLYPGVQQGDNGQSLVLGGVDADGNDVWNLLTELSLEASLGLKVIDPKINLRVSSRTPLHAFELGTRLTARGLGFPQYCNDDVVIPGLVDLGYSLEDARSYVVAACWEFIIPGRGAEVPNVDALSFPAVVLDAVVTSLPSAGTFDDVMASVRCGVRDEARRIAASTDGIWMEPAPFLSILMDGCVENRRDVSHGLRYNNYGIHGTGLSNAADSLAAVRRWVFDEAAVRPDELLAALRDNFEGHEDLWEKVKFDAPKLGDGDEGVIALASDLLTTFADALVGLHNDRGGIFRAGTGSAMYYVWYGRDLGALPDGRKAGEFLSANLAPSLGARMPGPLTLLRSFAALPTRRAINGGPVTIEMHDTVFRNAESTSKVAMLVRSFIEAGGHQLQLNAVDAETLRDAQQHPELHRGLIVRVWGWSAYFIELDREYQDQVIQRVELTL